MTLGYTAADRDAAGRLLTEAGIADGEPFAILVPKTTWSTKCWPAERFVALGDALQAQGVRLLLTGSGSEREGVEWVASRMAQRPAMAAGNLSFRELAAVIDRAALLVSGDTGPMHAAAALKTRYVALFGSTSPLWYAPRSLFGKVLFHPLPCGPCDQKVCANVGEDFEKCMRLLTVEEALTACQRQLAVRKAVPS